MSQKLSTGLEALESNFIQVFGLASNHTFAILLEKHYDACKQPSPMLINK